MNLGQWSVLLLAEHPHGPVWISGVGVAERTNPERKTPDPGTASTPFHRRKTDVCASQGSPETAFNPQRNPHLLMYIPKFSYTAT